MGKKVRINNLSEDTTVQDLRELFSTVGVIAHAKISREEESGLSRGYGFVEMETDDAARSAILSLNGQTLRGRQIRVGVVRPASKQQKRAERPSPARPRKHS